MKQAAKAMSDIHGKLCVLLFRGHDAVFLNCCALLYSTIDKVDATMAEIQEQTQIANEVSEAISSNTGIGVEIDDVRPRTLLSPFRSRLTSLSTFTGRVGERARGARARRAQRAARRGRARTYTPSSGRSQGAEYVSLHLQMLHPCLI